MRSPRISGLKVRRIYRYWIAVRLYRAQLGLSLRVTLAALLSLAVAQSLDLPLPLWAALTAIIVTQMSVGRSLKATINYLSGTLGGAVYGAGIAVFVPHSSETALLAALAIAVAPLALIAAINSNLSAAPITGVIVILLPEFTHASPVASAVDRVIEVALGGCIGFVVSLLVLPSNAHRLAIEAAAGALDQMARALVDLMAGLKKGRDIDSLHRIQDHLGEALVQLSTIAAEAEHERSARLAAGPDTRPLMSTLLRLRHDLVMIGRVTLAPLPEILQARLQSPLAQVEAAIADCLRASSAALRARRPPPSPDRVESSFAAYAAEVAAIRGEGLTRSLPGDSAERFFTLGFAFEQMHQDLQELEARVVEWAEPSKRARRAIADRVVR